ncbi:CTRB [Mytilus coruscus]|uniref:CTRB n=1 Tax=Mytilus coruscus TaxID=42192 RepID=A0A6J8BP45_MYTCO|nr:CTRB [Mytilus coruscus]
MYRVLIVSAFVVFYMATFCSGDTSVKIINGDNANIEDNPWMVSVEFRENENSNFEHECGGSIIDKSWVLTAAHCNVFKPDRPANDIRVAAGSSFKSQMKVKIPVKKYYMHEKFEPYNTGELDYDLMLLQLKKPLKFGPTINKIDLDTDIGKNYTGDICTITGWGDTDATTVQNFPDRLQVVSMPAVTNEYCGIAWNITKTYWNNILCLQDKDKDSCKADSGGPAVCSKKLVGILSFGNNEPCASSLPSVHTRISAFLDWIKEKMNTKNKKNKKNKKGKGKKSKKGKGKKNKKNNRN